MLVLAGICVQDLATFEVGMGPWYELFVALGPRPMGTYNARAPTAADIVGFLIDCAFVTGKASIEAFNVACCWQGVWRYQEIARFLENQFIRAKYGLVTADVAFAVAHVPPPYSSPFHIHLLNLVFTDLKEKLFLAIENNPLHPGIGIRLYDLTTGKPSTYLHRFSRADVLRVRNLSGEPLRALSATGPFRILVAAAGRISGVDLLDGMRHLDSHESCVPTCGMLGQVFCGYWCDVGHYGSTLMIGAQLAYYSFNGAKCLLDKGVTHCDADAIAAARVARDAALTDLTDADRAELAAKDAAWSAWPGPMPECRPATEGTVAARLVIKAAGGRTKVIRAALSVARNAAAAASKAAVAATRAAAAARGDIRVSKRRKKPRRFA
jgi:hypothetical protein